MTAPTATPRGTPTGIPLKDGYQSLITFEDDPTIEFYEKSITPPGMDGGEAIDQTTMHNATYRVQRSRSLITLTEMTLTVAYDPAVYDAIEAIINVEQTITVTWGDGSTLAFYGWLRMFDPQEMEEGEQPEAEITVTPSNWDPAAQTEEGPTGVYTVNT